MNICEILENQAACRPGSPAIVESRNGCERSVTFEKLNLDSRRFASLLTDSGLVKGDRVLIATPMSIELYTILLGAFRIGVVCAFVDPSGGMKQMNEACAILRPAALIASARFHLLRLVSSGLRAIPRKFCTDCWLPGCRSMEFAGGDTATLSAEVDQDHPALITFTSGSTAQPKATVRSHGFLLAQHRILEKEIHLEGGEVDLATLPVFILANLGSGVTSVIPDCDLRRPGFIDAAPVIRQLQRMPAQRCVASPAFLLRLCDFAEHSGLQLPSFTKIYTGGAPVFPSALRRISHLAPRAKVYALYGSTEAEPIAHLDSREISEAQLGRMRSGGGLLTGKPVKDISLALLHLEAGRPVGNLTPEEFSALQEQCDGYGEIVVTGDHVMKGYLGGSGDEETKFRVEDSIWHRTGDLGRIDSDGNLWLLGRSSAAINDEKGSLHPFAVECAAMEEAVVFRCALTSWKGKRILLVQLVNHAVNFNAEAMKHKLHWAGLDEIIAVKEIPVDKRHNAKIDYRRLNELVRSLKGSP